jgi:probable F420-dependent oxidoreductase
MKIGAVMFFTSDSMQPAELGIELEQRGFESLWVPEHTHIPLTRRTSPPSGGPLIRPYFEIYDPFVALSTAAAVTKNLKIGTGVCLIPQRDPIVTAKLVSSLDRVSNGRFLFGVGNGWNRDEIENHGTVFKTRHKLGRERIEAMKRIWTEDEPEYHGELVNIEKMSQWPKPVQKPHPPVYIPGAGSTETMRFCAERRYTYMSVYAPTRIVRRWFDGYRAAADELGYVPDPEKIAFSVPVYVAETSQQAHEEARPAVEWLYHQGLKQTAEMVTPPGYMSPGSLRGVLASGMQGFRQSPYEELIANGQAVVGSPEEVADRLGRLHAELGGFGQLIALFSIGPATHHQVMRSAELFASGVMPALRPLGLSTSPA